MHLCSLQQQADPLFSAVLGCKGSTPLDRQLAAEQWLAGLMTMPGKSLGSLTAMQGREQCTPHLA